MAGYRVLIALLLCVTLWSMIAALVMQEWPALGICTAVLMVTVCAILWEGIRERD
jgi:hypothetical protein